MKRVYLQAVVDVPDDFVLDDDVTALLAPDDVSRLVQFAVAEPFNGQVNCDCEPFADAAPAPEHGRLAAKPTREAFASAEEAGELLLAIDLRIDALGQSQSSDEERARSIERLRAISRRLEAAINADSAFVS